jgi:hypothetical protein
MVHWRFTLTTLLLPSAAAFLPKSVPPTSFRATSRLFSAVSGTSMSSEVKVGDKLPKVTLMEGLGNFEKSEIDLVEMIAGKKVAIFGVPGAFTPGCSKSHLPSFMDAQDELQAKGVDMTICVATNDVFVMEVSIFDLGLAWFEVKLIVTCCLT